jgi:hypothetical protein
MGDRAWLAVLFGFSTPLWWVTTRGGVWHTGQLVATVFTLLALVEWFGSSRPWLIGLLAGAAFLSRAPLLLAIPFYALAVVWDSRRPRIKTLHEQAVSQRDGPSPENAQSVHPIWRFIWLCVGFGPAVFVFLAYNFVRFGAPLESGYGLALLPDFLARQRDAGLFSIAHLGMNLDYFLWHLPMVMPQLPFLKPDGFGMSVFLTSPGLLLAAWAPWRQRLAWLLGGAFLATLLPSLFYYGGGWFQYGYRYALDAMPFAIALTALTVAREPLSWRWKTVIVLGVSVNLIGVYWARLYP